MASSYSIMISCPWLAVLILVSLYVDSAASARVFLYAIIAPSALLKIVHLFIIGGTGFYFSSAYELRHPALFTTTQDRYIITA
jgi:hypothetical protein